MFWRNCWNEGNKGGRSANGQGIKRDSIPVNFLHAIDGTMLKGTDELNPVYCLKVLAMFRYVNPTKEIRISGGRKIN